MRNISKLKTALRDSVVFGDTCVASLNIGDQIIRQSARKSIEENFPEARVFTVPTHTPLGKRGRMLVNASAFTVVSGTNLIGYEKFRNRVWKFGLKDAVTVRNKVCLLGCGLFSYEATKNKSAKYLLRAALHNGPQSVRDEYTREYLMSLGFEKVFATGCPTTWYLDQSKINNAWAQGKTDEVVFALNSNRQSPKQLQAILALLCKSYSRVHLWKQRPVDEIEIPDNIKNIICAIDPRISQLEEVLVGKDYIGGRLHAGIKALELGSRSLIIAVDNRANEMAVTSGLPCARLDQDIENEIYEFISERCSAPVINARKAERQEYFKGLKALIG